MKSSCPLFPISRRTRLSRRHSYVACVLVYHLHDHIAWASHNGDVKTVRAKLEASAGVYWRIIEGIATGVKHAVVTSNKIKHVPGTETVRPPALWDVALWDYAKWDDESGGLEIDHQGIRYDLYDCVDQVLRAYATCCPDQFATANL
jgi:hypothetical protein